MVSKVSARIRYYTTHPTPNSDAYQNIEEKVHVNTKNYHKYESPSSRYREPSPAIVTVTKAMVHMYFIHSQEKDGYR